MQFRIITEYVAPNYENVYPDDITGIWSLSRGSGLLILFITITGDKANGYQAVLNVLQDGYGK